MIRVYALAAVLGLVDEGAYEDIDATSAAVAQDGSLVLTRQEFREVRDPGNLAAPPRQESTLPQLVVIIAAGLWGRVENLELDDAAGD